MIREEYLKKRDLTILTSRKDQKGGVVGFRGFTRVVVEVRWVRRRMILFSNNFRFGLLYSEEISG